MNNLNLLLNTFRSGTTENKIDSIIDLLRHADAAEANTLIELMNSGDQNASIVSAFILTIIGRIEGVEFFQTSESLHEHEKSSILSLAARISSSHKLIVPPFSKETQNNLYELLSYLNPITFSIDNQFINRLVEVAVKRTIGLILAALGRIERQTGKLEVSIEHNNKALEIGRELRDGRIIGTALGNLGIIFMEMDKYCQALNYFHESLAEMDYYNDPGSRKNRILYYLSVLYRKVGDIEKSRKSVEQALVAAMDENDIIGIGRCHNEIGINILKTGDDRTAEQSFLTALSCCKESNNRQTEGDVLSNLSFVYAKRCNYKLAIETLLDALTIFRSSGNKSNESDTLVSLAYTYLEQKDIRMAYKCANEARDLAKVTVSLRDDMDACYILGTINDYHLNKLELAYENYKEAIDIYEDIRKDLMLDDLKISFSRISDACYEQMVSLCIKMGKKEEAFLYVERSKSRALIDLLFKTINIDEITPHSIPAQRVEELNGLKDRLTWHRKRLRRLYASIDYYEIEKIETNDKCVEKNIIFKEIVEIENASMGVYEDIKRIDPEWTSLSYVEPLEMEKLRQLIDRDSTLIEYYQTANKIFIFVVSKNDDIRTFQLDVDENSMKELLGRFLNKVNGDTILNTRSHQYIREIKSLLTDMYDLLIRPLEDALKDTKHLIIIPHLFWHHLPFHALYDKKSKKYLIDKFEIAYVPSASVLIYCYMKEKHSRQNTVIFANPTGDLPFAEMEAEIVARYFGKQSTIYKGEEATLKRLCDSNNVDIIHLSCHGIFRDDKPELSHLFLADSDEGGGVCFLPDIFNLRLNTTLVTMSACESGLSFPSSGDDLIGFARGFFYAGASSIISTLWKVNDKSTAYFMEEFYNNLILKKMTKSKAIQRAFLKLKSSEDYQHPYFWAPFMLIGDWR